MTDQQPRRCEVRNCGFMVAPPHTYCERHRYRERKKTMPGKTELTDDETAAALYATASLLRDRRRARRPIPHALIQLERKLDLHVRLAATGQQNDAPQPHSDTEPGIGSVEAARLLGCSTRTVRRLAADLDAHQVSGRWVYTRRAVLEYQEARQCHNPTSSPSSRNTSHP